MIAALTDFSSYSSGVSEQADELVLIETKIQNHTSQSISLGWRAILNEQLLDLFFECQLEGWDGYDANPINLHTLSSASRFIELLPNNIETPDIVPEPSGEVGFLWSRKHLTFVISINPDQIIYAGVLASSKLHGEYKFLNELPPHLEQILLDYFSA